MMLMSSTFILIISKKYSWCTSIQNSGVKESELGEDLTNVVAGILANIKPGMLKKNSGGAVAQR